VTDLRPVEAQWEAYNAGDVERFLACHARDVVVEDSAGTPPMQAAKGCERARNERDGPIATHKV